MVFWAVAFLILAVGAALYGFGIVAAGAAGIAQLVSFVFLVLFALSLVVGLMRRGGGTPSIYP